MIFLVRFFPSLAGILVMVWYSRQLDPAVYGAYQNFWVQLYLLSALGCMGVHAFVVTYSPEFITRVLYRLSNRFYLAIIGWLLAMGIIFTIIQSSSGSMPAYLSACFFLSFSLSVIGESFLILYRRLPVLAAINLIYTIAFCLLHWEVLQRPFQLQSLFQMLLVLVILKLAVFVIIVRGQIRKSPVSHGEEPEMKKLRSLWLHLAVYDVSQMVFRWVDKFIISLLLSRELSAIYFNGSTDIPFFPLLLGAVGTATLMHLADVKEPDDRAGTINLMLRSSRILSSIVFPVFFFFIFFRYEVFEVLFSGKYLVSVPVFFVSLMVIPLRAYNFTSVLQNRHKGDLINLGAVLDLAAALLLMFPFYKWLGLPGVALSFVVSSYFQAGFYLYHTAREIGVSATRLLPVFNWLVKMVVAGVAFFFFHNFFEAAGQKLLVLGWGLALTALIVGIMLWLELMVFSPKRNKA